MRGDKMSKNAKTKKRERWYFGIVNFFLRGIFTVFAKLTYNYKPKKFRLKRKTPYLILSNHLATLDPVFVGLSFNRPIIYVTADGIFKNKIAAFFLRVLVAPISKQKGAADVSTIKEIDATLRQGSAVCLFPEGNRPYDGELVYISPSIAKLARMFKVNVLLYRIEGGYLSSPRWKHKGRKGKMRGYVQRVLTPEEISGMTNDELYQAIIDGIRVSTKVLQQTNPTKYKSNIRAEYLELATYRCPKCQKVATISSKGNNIKCSACGLEAHFTKTGELEGVGEKLDFVYVSQWMKWQRQWWIDNNIANDGFEIARDACEVYKIEGDKGGTKVGEGEVVLTTNTLTFPEHSGLKTFQIEDIISIVVMFQNLLCINVKDGHYKVQLKSRTASPLKYMDPYYYFKAKTQGETPSFWGI